MLGHDAPVFPIDLDFLEQKGLWIHCKNLHALFDLNKYAPHLNYFWHENDQYTLTSRGYVWAYPGMLLDTSQGSRCIEVLPEHSKQFGKYTRGVFGICSDYVSMANK